MSEPDRPADPDAPSPSDAPLDVGDENTARLLQEAYRPEPADPDFIERMRAAVIDAGARRHQETAPVTRNHRPLAWIAAAAAILLAFVLGSRPWQPRPEVKKDGDVVWIDGQAYTLSRTSGRLEPVIAPVAGPDAIETGGAMNPRQLAEAPAAAPLAIGETVSTAAGERKRLRLPDGSLLYVNQESQATLTADRTLELASGEVFVEVSPRAEGSGETFRVQAGSRTVSALGTKFRVKAKRKGVDVLVTQGKVKVDDVMVLAGQQLGVENQVAPAARATHLLRWTRDLIVAGASPLVPSSKHAGGALICVDPWGQQTRLTLRRYHVDVHIEDGFARTTIDQTYFNHENWRQEGTFYFPLPPDASLSRLAMYVDGKLMEGGMAERGHARRVFETIVSRQKDPALLEWVDGSTFKMRVFPLEAREEKRILISYTQRLPELYGRSSYRFPGGHNLGLIRDWSLKVALPNSWDWRSPSHKLGSEAGRGLTTLTASAKRIVPDKDVVLELQRKDGVASDQARFAQITHDGARYLMLRYKPELKQAASRQRRDWIFLLESSGDRNPLLARAQVEIAKAMLANAEHADTFQFVTAGTRLAGYQKAPLAATPANLAKAGKWLDSIHLIGALDLGRAFRAVAAMAKAPAGVKDWNPHVVHLGGGVATLGERQADELAKLLPRELTYVGVGVGKRWARGLMKQLAGRSGGLFTQINPDEPVRWRARELLATLDTPRLLDVRVVDAAEKVAFRADVDALADGELLMAAARLPKGAEMPRKLIVSGLLAGERVTRELTVPNELASAGTYLPRAWAKLEIDALLADDGDKHKQRIIELSKQMYVMSPFTSLLVLENEAMYEQFKVDRGRKDHWALYPAPEKTPVVFEPDPDRPIQQRTPGRNLDKPAKQAKPRPSDDQLLNTLIVRLGARALSWPGQPYQGHQALTALQALRGGFAISHWGRWGGWAGRWYDPNGQHGMQRWAKQAGFAEPTTTTAASNFRQQSAQKEMDDLVATRSGEMAAGKSFSRRRRMPGPAASMAPRSEWGFDRNEAANDGDAPGDFAEPGLRRESQLRQGFFAMREMRQLEALEKRVDRGRMIRSVLRSRGHMLVYQRPQFTGDWRVFGDLLRFAPGMNTSEADLRATLEREGRPDDKTRSGHVDPGAKALIDAARGDGWTVVQLRGEHGEGTLRFDAAGRYRIERVLPIGLREQVICDGERLWHLYPELGVGAVRQASRFHSAAMRALCPTALAPASELARGRDVRLVAPRVVGLVPHAAANRRDDEGRPVFRQLELVFGEDGQLREKRVRQLPGGEIVGGERFADGVASRFDGDGKVTGERACAAKAGDAPSLTAETEELVVLPLPFRVWNHEWSRRKLGNNSYAEWSEQDALAMVSCAIGQSMGGYVREIGRARFLEKGDRRPGWYVLMLASGASWNPEQKHHAYRGWGDPAKRLPDSAIARYCSAQLRFNHKLGHNKAPDLPTLTDDAPALLRDLHALRDVFYRYRRGDGRQQDKQARESLELASLRTITRTPNRELGWAALMHLLNYSGHQDAGFFHRVGEACERFAERPELAYPARYEAARMQLQQGKRAEAYAAFRALLEGPEDGLARLDHSARQALSNPPKGQPNWADLMRTRGAKLIEDKRLVALVYQAWQCWQLGDQMLGEELLALALTAPGGKQLGVTLTALEMVWHSGQVARAGAMIDGMLRDPELAKEPMLHRVGAMVAQRRGFLARSLHHQERAIELEYADLPEVINLAMVRNEFSGLLQRYLQLANAIATLEQDVPRSLVARVVRAADRWRALDNDDTQACRMAAQVLTTIGAHELAWDYQTTPLADRPNEAQPWMNLGNQLQQQGQFDLALRAFGTAFEIDATHAPALWQQGQLFLQLSRVSEARAVFRQLAEGTWGRNHRWLQSQARNMLRSGR